MPIVVLKANSNKIRNLRKQAIENKLQYVDFLNTMSIGTYEEEYKLTSADVEDYSDIDGNFEDIDWNEAQLDPDETITCPDIAVESGYPYYLEQVMNNIYQASDEAVIEKSYEKTYIVAGEEQVYQYKLLNYGVDITIETNADTYYKDLTQFIDYGWYFEDKAVDVSVLLNFGLAPWVPTGLWNNSYSIVGGWAGIFTFRGPLLVL